MKKFAFQALFLVLAILGGVYITANQSLFDAYLGPLFPGFSVSTPEKPSVGVSKAQIGSVTFNIDIADTDEKRRKGLSGIDSIAKDYGMLFVFEKEEIHTFWMKGVRFPLDFIWLRNDIVVDLTPNIQPPVEGQADELIPRYQPKDVVNKVLEVSGGSITASNIKIGDKVTFK